MDTPVEHHREARGVDEAELAFHPGSTLADPQ
jgi:hypothetical protein